MGVRTKNGKAIGVIKDNCSTDNYLNHQKTKEQKLEGVNVVHWKSRELILQSKSILKSIKFLLRILGRIYTTSNVRGLEEIMRGSNPINPGKYTIICDKFGIKLSEIK